MENDFKSNKKKSTKKAVSKKNSKKQTYNKKKKTKKSNCLGTIIVFTIILSVIIALILFSDLFNITKITVINNSKITTEEIIQNSNLVIGNNMFKTLKTTSKNGIKSNPYIEEVKISRRLDGEVVIDIKERTATYMLQRENDYAYINNQGYILEISNTKLELPIIKGYSTTEFVIGNRIDISDLEKLDIIIEIMEVAKSKGIKNIITAINISDGNNFILEIPTEGKTVQFGDETNINVKVLWIVDLITREKGIAGEIVLNVTDIKKVYFREKV